MVFLNCHEIDGHEGVNSCHRMLPSANKEREKQGTLLMILMTQELSERVETEKEQFQLSHSKFEIFLTI
jgi:hypothetical protein